jgi:ATP adenylyltransferase
LERNYLYNTEKIKYVKGDKPSVECILCAIIDNDPLVKNLTIHSTEKFIIAVNLFPFNPGHVMIFPKRHICQINELTNTEVIELHELLAKTITIIDEEFKPSGYNIGYNIGEGSGASIPHLHLHIVPRYTNEVGFLDVLSGARIIVSDPVDTMERLRRRYNEKNK